MTMNLDFLLFWISAACTIGTITVLLLVFLVSRRNEGTFRCDCCGRNHSINDEQYHIENQEVICDQCYGIMNKNNK